MFGWNRVNLKLLAAICVVGMMPWAATGQLKLTGSAAVKESYDSNVYLRGHGDLSNRESMVTTFTPTVALEYKPQSAANTKLTLSYSPEATFFASESDENSIRHIFNAGVSAKQGALSLETTHCVTYTDGPNEMPNFAGLEGGGPTLTAPALRDRRDAVSYRNGLTLKYTRDPWFVRPVFNSYIHDFNSARSTTPGYWNVADRTDLSAGADVGFKAFKDTYLVLGYRYGQQTQEAYLGNPLHYNNLYQRALVGIEGKPFPWMKVSILAGPDFRHFGEDVAPGFNRNRIVAYYDAAVVFSPTNKDDITLQARQFMQPGSSGRGVYDDIAYSVSFKHKLTSELTLGAGFRAYFGDCMPAIREDALYTSNISIAYKLSSHLSAEASYLYEVSESRRPLSSGHEFDHQVVSLGLKYDF